MASTISDKRRPATSPADAPRPRRPLVIRWGKRLRPGFNRLLARFSLVPDEPVLDPALFDWTALLRAEWRAIRDEALAVTCDVEAVPALAAVSPDHARIARGDRWRSFFLVGYGAAIAPNLARCPRTAAVLARVPGLNSGFFSILQPGTHIPLHRGVTKGLLTCHLGLVVPQGALRMAVDDRVVRWAEGETLVFDDSRPHEVWNDTAETRVVLLIQFERPLRQPGRLLARALLGAIRRSPFVREARRNVLRWHETMGRMDEPARR